ncbi:hypothetical protein KC939_00085 [Candidatus Saccharibacteria bacterium]|nr:hypothetical protein [Candidatus Saccharibacteria bacterium]
MRSGDLLLASERQEKEQQRLIIDRSLGGNALDMAKNNKLQSNKIDIVNVGRIADTPWPGAVSADELVKSRKLSIEKIENAIDRMDDFYVVVHPGAKTRCIDGRHDPKLNETELGPQVPGGAPGAALAYRLGVDEDELARGTFSEDAKQMIGIYNRLGLNPGGHRDEHSHESDDVGCGAIDRMDYILKIMVNSNYVAEHKRVVKAIMGPMFNRDNHLHIIGSGVFVDGRSEDYFRGRESVMDYLEEKFPDSVSTLTGHHEEALIVANFVPGTTLSSNRLTEETGVQAFGYDVWRSLEMAGKILPRPDQVKERERFVAARISCTIATLMALTDGSQRLLIRLPGEAQEEAVQS